MAYSPHSPVGKRLLAEIDAAKTRTPLEHAHAVLTCAREQGESLPAYGYRQRIIQTEAAGPLAEALVKLMEGRGDGVAG